MSTSLVDLLRGETLNFADNSTISAKDYFKDKKILALYFSAHWCPPCRKFTPVLKQTIQQLSSSLTGVLFISSDRSYNEQMSYMRESHGNWPTLNNPNLKSVIATRCNVRGIPKLVIIDAKTGDTLSDQGVQEVYQSGVSAFQTWESMVEEIDTSLVGLLKDNPERVKNEAVHVLTKLFENIIRDPQNIRYRSIRISNPKIESMLSANGAFEIIFAVGFEENDETLVMPLGNSLHILKAFLAAMKKIDSTRFDNKRKNPNLSEAGPSRINNPQTSQPVKENTPEIVKYQPKQNENSLDENFLDLHKQVMMFEMKTEQDKAKEVIPQQKLQNAASEKFQIMKKADPNVKESLYKDLLIVELLNWFHQDFFKWFKPPMCVDGITPALIQGMLKPTETELIEGARNVEGYLDSQSGKMHRFPRYHHIPSVLLKTRVGRCGEFANCFGLICVAMGYDVRFVTDRLDHVWIEVYSENKSNWIHCDPCENKCDTPLMYEQGWGKKINFVIAASKYDVVDVTWRYTHDHDVVRKRRSQTMASMIPSALKQCNAKIQLEFSNELKQKIVTRNVQELAASLTLTHPVELSDAEKEGRQSGSLDWRVSRGEMGAESFKEYSWKPTLKELEKEIFQLEYDVVKDEYIRVIDNNSKISGWQNGLSLCKNMTRKVEKDWNMVYLARKEGTDKAMINWQVNLNDCGYEIKSVEFLAKSQCFENGKIRWQICGGENAICLMPVSGTLLKTSELSGCKKLTISAHLSDGKGNVAWQHTQLFRTSSVKPSSDIQFLLRIYLRKCQM